MVDALSNVLAFEAYDAPLRRWVFLLLFFFGILNEKKQYINARQLSDVFEAHFRGIKEELELAFGSVSGSKSLALQMHPRGLETLLIQIFV